MRHRLAFALIALAGAAADLLSKHLVFARIAHEGEEIEIIRGFWYFGKTMNPGIVFGLGRNAGPAFLWISVLAVPVIIFIFESIKRPKWLLTASFGLILGGTIGNMYDRIAFGAVRDFLKFILPGYGVWPLFNIADSCICVGVALLTVDMLFFDGKKEKKEEGPLPAAVGAAKPGDPAAP